MTNRGNVLSKEFCHHRLLSSKTFHVPEAARFSKASRASLTQKRGNKDYYKGLFSLYCFAIALY